MGDFEYVLCLYRNDKGINLQFCERNSVIIGYEGMSIP